jgi:hypothetical protein
MKKLLIATAGAALIALSIEQIAQATPFTLFYNVQESSGKFLYNFDLVQTEAVGSVTNLNWIIFFDKPWLSPFTTPQPSSDIQNPVLVGLPPAPFTSLTSSSGGHNGPTFLEVCPVGSNTCDINFLGWYPSGIGDALSWSILADNLVTDIQWTNLISSVEVEQGVDHQAVRRSQPIPEPTSILSLIGISTFLGFSSSLKRLQE